MAQVLEVSEPQTLQSFSMPMRQVSICATVPLKVSSGLQKATLQKMLLSVTFLTSARLLFLLLQQRNAVRQKLCIQLRALSRFPCRCEVHLSATYETLRRLPASSSRPPASLDKESKRCACTNRNTDLTKSMPFHRAPLLVGNTKHLAFEAFQVSFNTKVNPSLTRNARVRQGIR